MSTNTTERLQAIEVELRSILQERITELMQVTRGAEEATRRIVSAEMEISQNRQLRENLESEIERVRGDVTALRGRVDEARSAHQSLFAERDQIRRSIESIERDAILARREIEVSRNRMARLRDERETLQQETLSFQNKLTTLEENVNRMRKLREEVLSSINAMGGFGGRE